MLLLFLGGFVCFWVFWRFGGVFVCFWVFVVFPAILVVLVADCCFCCLVCSL